jgi:hypothetical protein
MMSTSLSQPLEDGEHQLLLAKRAGILDLVLLGKAEEFGGGFGLEVLKLHFGHGVPGGEWEEGRERCPRRMTSWRPPPDRMRRCAENYATQPLDSEMPRHKQDGFVKTA